MTHSLQGAGRRGERKAGHPGRWPVVCSLLVKLDAFLTVKVVASVFSEWEDCNNHNGRFMHVAGMSQPRPPPCWLLEHPGCRGDGLGSSALPA